MNPLPSEPMLFVNLSEEWLRARLDEENPDIVFYDVLYDYATYLADYAKSQIVSIVLKEK